MAIKLSKEAIAAENEIFCAVGSALNAWMHVEDRLSDIFCLCIHPENKLPPAKAYWAVFSFQSRLDMVSAAVQARLYFEKDMLKLWDAAYNRLSRRAKKRNKIAHGCLQPDKRSRSEGDKPYWSPFHWAYEVSTLPHGVKERKKHYPNGYPRDRLFVPDIQALQETFEKDEVQIRGLYLLMRPIVLREEASLQDISAAHRRAIAGMRAARTPKGK
jgi:hypothetical protein